MVRSPKYFKELTKNLEVFSVCVNHYLAIAMRDTIHIKFHEKVYLRSKCKCCVVDFRADRDHLNQYCNFGKIRTEAAKSNSITFRERFDVTEILKG